MKTLFIHEYQHSSLQVLNDGEEKTISIASSWGSCDVDINYSWYFGCNASRLSSNLYLNVMKNMFTLVSGQDHYRLKVRNLLLCLDM